MRETMFEISINKNDSFMRHIYLKQLLASLLLLCTTAVAAQEFAVNGLCYRVTDTTDRSVEVIPSFIAKYVDNVTVPQSVTYEGNTYSVTGIGNKAFYQSTITGITLPNSIKSIGESAFELCNSLISVTIPNSVVAIGNSAFSYSNKLTSVTIGNSVVSIGERAFQNCTVLTDITIPNSVKSIGDYAFAFCSEMESITIGHGVTSIGKDVFIDCGALQAVYMNDLSAWCRIDFASSSANPLSSAKELYLNSVLLTELVVPGDITAIKNHAFCGNGKIETVVIHDGVTTIGDGAFSGCAVLKDIAIPNSVRSVGESAFYKCTSLEGITVPNSVTALGDQAFYGCSGLKNVTISNSVTRLGYALFYGCTGLTGVTIPNGVITIGNSVFSGCSGLESVTIPNSVVTIELSAFSGCSRLKDVTIPDGVTSIGSSAFSGCSGLENITIPGCVATIGSSAFYSCTALKSIAIPGSVISIGNDAFTACDALEAVHVTDLSAWCRIDFAGSGSNPLYIAENLYLDDELVTVLVVPEDVADIKQYAFIGCKSIVRAEIHKDIASIGEKAFMDCKSLKTVINLSDIDIRKGSSRNGYIASNAEIVVNAPGCLVDGDFVWRVEDGVNTLVAYVGNATELILPADYNGEGYVIGDNVFEGNVALVSVIVPDCVTSIGNAAFKDCYALADITIGSSVASIGSQAFYGCSALSGITVPNSVTAIGDSAFEECRRLRMVMNFSNLNLGKGSSENGHIAFYAERVINAPNGMLDGDFVWIVNDDANIMAAYIGDATELVMPADYNGEGYMIGDKAFENNSLLVSVTIPDRVTSIGNSAFYECPVLADVTMGIGVTSIGDSAFNGCFALAGVVIPDNVVSIGNSAFYGCSAIAGMVVPSSVTSIGDYAFEGCSALEKVINFSNLTLRKGTTGNGHIAYYAKVVVNAPNGSVEGDFVFGRPNELNTLVAYLGESVELTLPADYDGESYVIGEGAFQGSGITKITIGDAVTDIGNNAFSGCSVLESVTVGNGVINIGDYLFRGLSKLKSVTLGDGVVMIGNYAFAGCQSLTNVKMPSVRSIGVRAFENCTSFRSIDLGKCLEYIGESAFSGCRFLTSIEIPSRVVSIGKNVFDGCRSLTSVISRIPADVVMSLYFEGLDGGETSLWASSGFSANACTLYVPYGAMYGYEGIQPWNEFGNIVELEEVVTDVTITINQYGSGTYCSKYALDFSGLLGLKAYAATGYKSNSQVVTLMRVQTAEAGTGLFLKGEPGEYVVPVIESTDEHSLNMLVGTLESTIVDGTTSDGLYTNYKYTIKSGDTAPMFYQFADGSSLGAGKAYLQIPTAWLPVTASKSISIRFDDGETTDIDEVDGENENAEIVYDLSGRKVNNPVRGVYIKNGKKIFIR